MTLKHVEYKCQSGQKGSIHKDLEFGEVGRVRDLEERESLSCERRQKSPKQKICVRDHRTEENIVTTKALKGQKKS